MHLLWDCFQLCINSLLVLAHIHSSKMVYVGLTQNKLLVELSMRE